jgi:hypothetical protein
MKKTSFFVVCVLSCLSCRHVKKRGGAISVRYLSHTRTLSPVRPSLSLSLSLSLFVPYPHSLSVPFPLSNWFFAWSPRRRAWCAKTSKETTPMPVVVV